jgi:hypothetical protein
MKMPEYRNAGKKVIPASLVLPFVCLGSPASAFRYLLQSGTADHGLVRQKITLLIWKVDVISIV